MATQVSAVTGIPFRERFRRPSSNYILDLFAQRDEKARAERELAATERYRQQQLDLAQEAYKQGKQSDVTGLGIAGVGLGTQALLTYDRGRDMDRYYGRDYTAPSAGGGTDTPWYSKWYSDVSQNYIPILVGGAGGAAAGQAGKKSWQKALIGAGVGGLMGYLGSEGGSPYAAGTSAALGGAGALALDLLL